MEFTPSDPKQRGAQLSIMLNRPVKPVHDDITAFGVVVSKGSSNKR
jgi:hypothetical protein